VNDKPVLEPDLVGSHRFLEDMRLLDEGVRSYLLLPLRTRGRSVGVLGLAATAGGFDDAALVRMQPSPTRWRWRSTTCGCSRRPGSCRSPTSHAALQRALLPPDAGARAEARRPLQVGALVVFLDLDRFKPINDKYGHLRGSRVLREVGFLLREAVRETDYPARYGGDEFVVVLPQTDDDGALQMAERLQQAIAEHVFLQEEDIDVRLWAPPAPPRIRARRSRRRR
jgi:GAF domain-containing protein